MAPVRFARLVVFAWLALLALWGWQVARTPAISDLTHFLPTDAGSLQRILVDQMREGAASRLILIALEGGDGALLARLSRDLGAALRADGRFLSVHNGNSELSAADREFLLAHRYQMAPLQSAVDFSETGLRAALEGRLAELATSAGLIDKPVLARDPTAALRQVLKVWVPAQSPNLQHGVWFSRDGSRALLVAETAAPGFDLDGQADTVEALRAAFAAVRGDSGVRLVLAGPPVFSVDANRRIAGDATRLSLLNSVVVVGLLWLVYRSARVVLLGAVPLLCGGLAATAAVGWWFGSIHGITLGFGATLIGVAADYPNHLFTHRVTGEPADHAIRRIWPTLRLGVLTNVAGFTAMLFSGFEGLAQLGLFAACGLLVAAAAVRWLVPLLMPEQVPIPAAVLRVCGCIPTGSRRWSWLPLVCGCAALAWIGWGPLPLWNDDIDALSPVPAASKQLDEALRSELGAMDLRSLVVVRGSDDEEVLVRSERLARQLDALVGQGMLAGYDMAARYLPSQASQRTRLQSIPTPEVLRASLQAALAGLPFREDAFTPFLADAAAAREAEPLRLSGPLPAAMGLRVKSLLLQWDDGWVGLVPLRGVSDEVKIQTALTTLALPGVDLVDLRRESSHMLSRYRNEALELLAWSSGAIVLLLVAGLRSIATAFRVLAPMACAAAAAAAIMAQATHGLNLFHLVSLLLVMGLSLDQALFFNRAAADREERSRTLLSLLLCNGSAVIAFGILATSSVNILHDIGATVALGAAFALTFAALLAREQDPPA
ncbi:MAG: hypothetical protein FIA97_01250 [Methylococcaceae bacterium]|nr:hypothetical protein [Methylococcaceae bacterium]